VRIDSKQPIARRASHHSPAILLAIAWLALSVPLAACSSSNPSSHGTQAGTVTSREQPFAFTSCMRANGVLNFPYVTDAGGMRVQFIKGVTRVDGTQVNTKAFESAWRACLSELPGHAPLVSAGGRAAMLHWATCMRSHGLPHFPDPTFRSVGGAALTLPVGMHASSSAFKSAERACGSISHVFSEPELVQK
jgi:hypothetical protein